MRGDAATRSAAALLNDSRAAPSNFIPISPLYCCSSSFCQRRIRWFGNRLSRVQERRFPNDTPQEECPSQVVQLKIFT